MSNNNTKQEQPVSTVITREVQVSKVDKAALQESIKSHDQAKNQNQIVKK